MSIGVSDKRNETKTPMNGLRRGRSPTRSVGARATAERSEAVRGAEGAEKPLFLLFFNKGFNYQGLSCESCKVFFHRHASRVEVCLELNELTVETLCPVVLEFEFSKIFSFAL